MKTINSILGFLLFQTKWLCYARAYGASERLIFRRIWGLPG